MLCGVRPVGGDELGVNLLQVVGLEEGVVVVMDALYVLIQQVLLHLGEGIRGILEEELDEEGLAKDDLLVVQNVGAGWEGGVEIILLRGDVPIVLPPLPHVIPIHTAKDCFGLFTGNIGVEVEERPDVISWLLLLLCVWFLLTCTR